MVFVLYHDDQISKRLLSNSRRAIAYGKNRVDFSVWENSPKEEKKVKKHPVEKLKDHFVDVEDPRSDNASHLLIDIITIAICALILNSLPPY